MTQAGDCGRTTCPGRNKTGMPIRVNNLLTDGARGAHDDRPYEGIG